MPRELSAEQQRELVRKYCREHFVSAGMCVDISIHDKKDGNPHAHIMLTMRPFEPDGAWGAKSKKEYLLDKNGERLKLKNGTYKTRKIDTVDWNDQSKAEEWRCGWASIANEYLSKQSMAERVDHRSFERQGTEQIPTIHMGVAATQMESRGIATVRGEENRKIKSDNQLLRELGARINKLKNWLNDELETAANKRKEPNLIETLASMLDGQERKGYRQKIVDHKAVSKALNFLETNGITSLPQLHDKVKTIYDSFYAVSGVIKKHEKRLQELATSINHAENYMQYKAVYKQYKQENPKKQDAFHQSHYAEIANYEDAERYFKQNLGSNTTVPIKAWKSEVAQLGVEKDRLYKEYYRLKDEVRDVESIKRNVEQATREDGLSMHQHRKLSDIEQ